MSDKISPEGLSNKQLINQLIQGFFLGGGGLQKILDESLLAKFDTYKEDHWDYVLYTQR